MNETNLEEFFKTKNPFHVFKAVTTKTGCRVYLDPSLCGKLVERFDFNISAEEFMEFRNKRLEDCARESARRLVKAFKKKD